jgi:hypothetical protein
MTRLCVMPRKHTNVILNEVKNLMHSIRYRTQILRLSLRMTLRHSLDAGEGTGGELNGAKRLNYLNCLNSPGFAFRRFPDRLNDLVRNVPVVLYGQTTAQCFKGLR